jgi:predicted transcriptional regulator
LPAPKPTAVPDQNGNGALPKAQRAVLSVLAQHGRRSTTQVAVLTGYSSKSGGFRNSLSALRTAGLITGRGDVEVTPAGLDALGPYQPLPTGRELIEWWKREQLGKAERNILDVLVIRWPAAVPVDDIAAETGYSATSGGFRNALSRLRSLQLASGRGELTINDALMEGSQ